MREKKESQGSTQEVQYPTTKFRERVEKVQGREMAETYMVKSQELEN